VKFFKNLFSSRKAPKHQIDDGYDVEKDCSVPPPVIRCPKCNFGWTYGKHTEEQCQAAIKSMENVCPICNHPNHDYKEDKPDSGMCVQFIAGYGNIMPSICSCGRDELMARIKAKHEAKQAGKNES
jgi:hypothetical protein